MQTLVLLIHVALAITVIVLVLLQQGRGADAGAAFGSGSSATVFGAGGSGTFLQKLTTGVASLFFATSLTLAVMAAHRADDAPSVIDAIPEEVSDMPAIVDEPVEAEDVPEGDLPPID